MCYKNVLQKCSTEISTYIHTWNTIYKNNIQKNITNMCTKKHILNKLDKKQQIKH